MIRVRVKVKLAVFKNRSDSTKAQPLVFSLLTHNDENLYS